MFVCLFVSCDKEVDKFTFSQKSINQPTKVSVQNGMLCFENIDDYIKIKEFLYESNSDERKKWEESIGFVSMETKYISILDELESAKTQNEYENILNENTDIVYIDDEDFIRLQIEICDLRVVLNSKGLLMIGNLAHRYKKNQHYTALDGDYRKLEGENIEVNDNTIISHEFYMPLKQEAYTCGTFHSVTITNNDNDRSAKLVLSVYSDHFYYSNNTYQTYTYALVKGIPYKKNFWGNWVNYATNNYLDYDFRARINHPDYQGFNIRGSKSNNDKTSISHRETLVENQTTTQQNMYLYEGFLTRISTTKYRHRGMGDIWNQLDYCNSPFAEN